ncbi:rhodanese-like domain-containing protein [Tropicimonas isoalkanivorans]|uniref:Rhodanese-related sulfurtransferase n=1 Tax=Tropicimonas isoalkanivorans TaxID=441112 RepID=A0A1I1GAI1_9RHOB|nr:rhodanese-like domain-containing protein [Tropicimonas isoalkanivorans]SFC08749.1 Rhodanese-related sulfurtransferase [Tropicimonas isoalkanivorans]
MTNCAKAFVADTPADVTPITAEEASKLHDRAGVEFVDPRPVEAIAATTGIIPGARTISIAEIEAGTLPPAFDDRSIHVVTSCQAGPMGARAAVAFAELGFARVSYVDGGTEAWLKAGLPTRR